MKFGSERVGHALEVVLIVGGIEISSRAIAIQLLSVNQTPSEGEFVLVVDVPVEFHTGFVALGVVVGVVEATAIFHTLPFSSFLKGGEKVLCHGCIHARSL